MKIYKYWATEKQKMLIDGTEQQITTYGGSNSSVEDARLKAREKAEKNKTQDQGRKASLRWNSKGSTWILFTPLVSN